MARAERCCPAPSAGLASASERWERRVYGELGVLAVEEDDQPVRCHACGRAFRFSATHVRQAHALRPMSTADLAAEPERPARW